MTSQWKLLVVGSIILVVVAGGFYLWGLRQRDIQISKGRLSETEHPAGRIEVAANPAPVILLLLDVSGSLPSGQARRGRDPENREREATEILLQLVHHFSSPKEGGFAPRVGILTFGASPRWLRLGEKKIWQLRTPEALEEARAALDGVMGATAEEDRRRGTYTDYNGAFDEAVAALEEIGLLAKTEQGEPQQLPKTRQPLLVLMTDGEHNPYPGHAWNYGDTRPIDLEAFADKLRTATLESIETVKDALSPGLYEKLVRRLESLDYCRHEPLEYVQSLPFTDDEIAAAMEDPASGDTFPYALAAVRDVLPVERKETGPDLDQAARARLFDHYIQRLKGQVRFHVVGLSPMDLEEIRGRPEDDPEYRLWTDLKAMVETSGARPDRLRWCNDAGLVRAFLTIFEDWLRLLRKEESLEQGSMVEVGGHVDGLALLAEASEFPQTPLWLVGPDGARIEPATTRSGRHLFLLDRPAPGAYRVAAEEQKLSGSLLGLIQTDPLFDLVPLSPRGRLGGAPPQAWIVAFSAETGQRVPLHERFAVESAALEGELLRGSGDAMGRVRWSVRRDPPDAASEFELAPDFWTDELARKPGGYSVRTVLSGFEYRDGTPVTPQTIIFDFEIEPTVLVSVHDAEGFEHGGFGFPRRCLHLFGE